MLRKKKRQSEREADAATKREQIHKRDDNLDTDTNGGASRDDANPLEKEGGLNRSQTEVGESSAGKIDLNSDPNREDSQLDNIAKLRRQLSERMNMNQNGGLRTINTEVQEGQQHSSLVTQSNGEDKRNLSDERCIASIILNKERRDEVYSQSNENQNNMS
jgi:hypothetical protein